MPIAATIDVGPRIVEVAVGVGPVDVSVDVGPRVVSVDVFGLGARGPSGGGSGGFPISEDDGTNTYEIDGETAQLYVNNALDADPDNTWSKTNHVVIAGNASWYGQVSAGEHIAQVQANATAVGASVLFQLDALTTFIIDSSLGVSIPVNIGLVLDGTLPTTDPLVTGKVWTIPAGLLAVSGAGTGAAFVEPTTATPEQIANALIAAGLMAPS